jgi:hypothetical protein
MASAGKKKTTMAKLNREARLRERRLVKQASKDARKRERRDLSAAEAQPQLNPLDLRPTQPDPAHPPARAD